MGVAKRLKGITRGGSGIEFKLDPIDEQHLQRTLSDLSDKVAKKISRKALRTGGKVYIMELKRTVKSDRVERNIKGVGRTAGGVPGYIVAPQTGLPNPAWLEYGTMNYYRGTNPRAGRGYKVKKTKHFTDLAGNWWHIKEGTFIRNGQRPQPFVKPAWRSKKDDVLRQIEKTLKVEIEKLAHG
jgi:hypothetical protein